MAELWTPLSVQLEHGGDWQLDLALDEAAFLIDVLHDHNANAIRKHVLSTMDLTKAAIFDKKKKSGSDEDDEGEGASTVPAVVLTPHQARSKERKDRWGYLKGVAMEMVSAAVLTHLDRCLEATAWAKTRMGHPNSPAPKAKPDAFAVYPATDRSRAYTIVAEVSAREKMSVEEFRRQLDSALEHGGIELTKNPDQQIYGLVINGAKIPTNKTYIREYHRFLRQEKLEEDAPVRVIPVYAPDFAEISGNLANQITEGDWPFEADVFSNTFDTLYRAVRKRNYPTPEGWMVDLALDTIAEEVKAARPELPF